MEPVHVTGLSVLKIVKGKVSCFFLLPGPYFFFSEY